MRQRSFFISALLILIVLPVFPKQITFNEANTIADNWTKILEEKFSDQVRIEDGHTIYKKGIVVAYVFDFYPKGYVMISGEDYLPPIKMYSLENDFNTTGAPLEQLIFDRNAKVIELIKKGKISPRTEDLRRNRAGFSKLLNYNIEYSKYESLKEGYRNITQEVKPLLSTKWGQGDPYNKYCPVIDGTSSLTGCNATSLAQIMNYYEWPNRGVGEETYYDSLTGNTYHTSFDKEYQWWNMLDSYTGNIPEENKNAVATLMWDVGVAIHSGYLSPEWGTSADLSRFGKNIVTFLKYSSDFKLEHIAFYSNPNDWLNIAKYQIDNGWPCEYTISGSYGHSVVIDGYRITDSTRLVHINFGWNGNYNGYFDMNNIYINENLYFDDNFELAINIYPYAGYKRPTGKAPAVITGTAHLNRSLFLTEYVCTLTWSESPSEDKRIESYIIYRQKDGSIEELDRVKPSEGHSYTFRTNDPDSYTYSVGVVDKNGAVSDIPSFINLTLDN